MNVLVYPRVRPNKYVEILYDELERQGVNVSTPAKGNFWGFKEKYNAFHFHWVNFILDRSFISSFVAMICFICYLLILKVRGALIVWTLHNTLTITHHGKNPWIEKVLVKLLYLVVDRFIIHSEFQKSQVPRSISMRIKHIPHHSYLEKLIPTVGNELAFFGYIAKYKGVEDIISAFKQLRSNGDVDFPRVSIMGAIDSTYKQSLSNMVNENELSSIINLRFGFITDEHLRTELKKVSTIILPYHSITNSGSLVHALNLGKTVFIRECSLIQELFIKWPELKNVIFTFKNSNDLASLIVKVKPNNDVSTFKRFNDETHINKLVCRYISEVYQ